MKYTFKKDEKGFKSFAELLSDYDAFTIFEAYARPFYNLTKYILNHYNNLRNDLNGRNKIQRNR